MTSTTELPSCVIEVQVGPLVVLGVAGIGQLHVDRVGDAGEHVVVEFAS